MTIKFTLICATAIAIALTSFDLRPAAAAPEGGPAIAKQNAGADEFSSQRRRRARGVNPALPLAAFGAIIGTIGAVAAANARRDYYENHYYAPGYGGPAYGYYEQPAYQYYQAPVYQRHYQAPVYQRHGGYGRPGYRGPRNVPGATNYGNAAGQNGQAPPAAVSPSLGGSN